MAKKAEEGQGMVKLYRHTACQQDSTELIAICRDTYMSTFATMGYYTPSIVAGYLDTSFAPAKIASELAHPQHHFYFLSTSADPADHSGRVGYLKLVAGKPLPAAQVLAAPIYLERLYLKASAQGQGFGRKALAIAEQEAAALGGQTFWLTVWEYNTPAIGFYEKTGFTKVGETQFEFVSEGQPYSDTDYLYIKGIRPAG